MFRLILCEKKKDDLRLQLIHGRLLSGMLKDKWPLTGK